MIPKVPFMEKARSLGWMTRRVRNDSCIIIIRIEFLAKHTITPGGDISHAIHVIWYVIDASTGRVESKQIKSFVRMFPSVPILIILNKIDKSTEEEADAIGTQRNCLKVAKLTYLVKVLENLEIPTLAGIFKTSAAADPKSSASKTTTYSNCPKCSSDDIVLRKKTNTLECCVRRLIYGII